MLEVKSPWNAKILEKVPQNNDGQIEKILAKASIASKNKGLDFPPNERIKVFKKFSQKIGENLSQLASLAASEGGKPIKDSLIEIKRGMDGVDCCIEVLKNDSGNVIPMNIDEASKNRMAFTQKEPIGVVLAISAFNHPFNLIIHQIIPAIATGCIVVVKPAEDTPLSCLKIIDMLHESGLPKNRCFFVMPETLELATKLVEDKRVDFFSFIGSSKVGWFLRSKLSPGTRCALEHGGIAPTFLTESAELDSCCKSLARGAFYHSGQVCVSVQRIFVNSKVLEEFLDKFTPIVSDLEVGDPLIESTDLGPLIRNSEVERVDKWVKESIDNGSKLLLGGKKISNTAYDKTILLNPNQNDIISKNEIFGPVVCVYPYEKFESAIEVANSVNASFQSSIFTNNVNELLKFYQNINASAVFHNDHTAFRVDWMPFSGLKESGHGVGGIKYTMHEMQIDKMLVLRN
mgnify:CR=1 FL=1